MILIYDNGNVYWIDEAEIYQPQFDQGKKDEKTKSQPQKTETV